MREFLERDVMAATEGRVQFHTRVAVNVLNIVARELELGAELAERERRARGGAPRPRRRPPTTLERELAGGDPVGRRSTIRIDAVRAHVRETVREKLLIANPGYLPDASAA